MAVNMKLAEQQGLCNGAIMLIDTLHEHLENVISNTTFDHDESLVRLHVKDIEYKLQELWGFSQESRYHTWAHKLSKRLRELQYLGAVYRCKETGFEREVASGDLVASSHALFGVGNGFIDFGGVVRIVGNLERVK